MHLIRIKSDWRGLHQTRVQLATNVTEETAMEEGRSPRAHCIVQRRCPISIRGNHGIIPHPFHLLLTPNVHEFSARPGECRPSPRLTQMLWLYNIQNTPCRADLVAECISTFVHHLRW